MKALLTEAHLLSAFLPFHKSSQLEMKDFKGPSISLPPNGSAYYCQGNHPFKCLNNLPKPANRLLAADFHWPLIMDLFL
uniref:Uncharacterized protein n=1 Tax=Nelumbo nucifera TaxID=4432 RepID=A0A822XGJ3_NELNU|nr:TPA_asm: hypothetical protein HUJ06_020256 [Nelumbo nucifera]